MPLLTYSHSFYSTICSENTMINNISSEYKLCILEQDVQSNAFSNFHIFLSFSFIFHIFIAALVGGGEREGENFMILYPAFKIHWKFQCIPCQVQYLPSHYTPPSAPDFHIRTIFLLLQLFRECVSNITCLQQFCFFVLSLH